MHSHLRWDFVWQRPQHLFSRFAKHRDVLFVEEPRFLDDITRPTLDHRTPLDRLHRLVPRLPSSFRESESAIQMAVRSLMQALVAPRGALAEQFDHAIQWFYTPMIAPAMLGAFQEAAVVYDCMDDLTQFRFAPKELAQRERYLLARTDVVFAGDRTLAEAKQRYHDHVHYFGCGVDAEHFAAAMSEDTMIPAALTGLAGAILGYVGVVDERLDYALIAHLAEQLPDATLVLVGPIVTVDPRDLPRRRNIQYLGQQPYGQLPAFLKRFDVCLMPFALNTATEHLNPTKTLEYLAAGKPVVSTPIADMVRHFSQDVAIAESAGEYVEAVRQAAQAPDIERRRRGLVRARGASWEAITLEMSRLMDEAVRRRERRVHREREVTPQVGVIGSPIVVGPRVEREVRRAP